MYTIACMIAVITLCTVVAFTSEVIELALTLVDHLPSSSKEVPIMPFFGAGDTWRTLMSPALSRTLIDPITMIHTPIFDREILTQIMTDYNELNVSIETAAGIAAYLGEIDAYRAIERLITASEDDAQNKLLPLASLYALLAQNFYFFERMVSKQRLVVVEFALCIAAASGVKPLYDRLLHTFEADVNAYDGAPLYLALSNDEFRAAVTLVARGAYWSEAVHGPLIPIVTVKKLALMLRQPHHINYREYTDACRTSAERQKICHLYSKQLIIFIKKFESGAVEPKVDLSLLPLPNIVERHVEPQQRRQEPLDPSLQPLADIPPPVSLWGVRLNSLHLVLLAVGALLALILIIASIVSYVRRCKRRSLKAQIRAAFTPRTLSPNDFTSCTWHVQPATYTETF